MNLLIIDNRVADITQIVEALTENTKYILVEYFTETVDSLKQKIESLNEEKFQNVAYLSHANLDREFKMMDSSEGAILQEFNLSTQNSWDEVVTLIKYLATNYETENFDFLACALTQNKDWVNVLSYLENEATVNIRASDDDTGSLKMGGDWILESDNVNMIGLYFTEMITMWNHLLRTTNYEHAHLARRRNCIKYTPSSITLHGDPGYGAISNPTQLQSLYNTVGDSVVQVNATQNGFTALRSNGTVHVWGGNLPTSFPQDITNMASPGFIPIKRVYANVFGFCGIRENGTVYGWGFDSVGGRMASGFAVNNFGVPDRLKDNAHLNFSPPIDIYGTGQAFAALCEDKTVACWGSANFGGGYADNGVTTNTKIPIEVTDKFNPNFRPIIQVAATFFAFAVLREDGTVRVWGGNSNNYNALPNRLTSILDPMFKPIVKIVASQDAFVYLHNDGSLSVSGSSGSGGLSTGNVLNADGTVSITSLPAILQNSSLPGFSKVVDIGDRHTGFCVLCENGAVYTWGNNFGKYLLLPDFMNNTNHPNFVKTIKMIPTFSGLVAIRENATCISCGDLDGIFNSIPTNVANVYVSQPTCVVLTRDNTLISSNNLTTPDYLTNKANPAFVPITNVVADYLNNFIAIREDKSVVMWSNTYATILNIPNLVNISTSYAAFVFASSNSLSELVNLEGRDQLQLMKNKNLRQYFPQVDEIIDSYDLAPLIDGMDYLLINPNNVEIAPLTDPSTNFYVPCNDGEIVQISGTSFVSYGDKVYRIMNGKYVATAAMLINGKRFTFSGGSIIGMRDLVAAASGDPHVFPIFGKQYDLPNDESCYTLFDNKNKDDPFVITTKLYKIPRSYWVENRIPAFSRFSFFKYVCLQTKNEMMVLDVEAFSPVEYTNAEDMKANNLPAKHEKAFRNSDAFKIHAVQQDRFYFKSYYAEDSQLPLKPTFNGEYRDIDVKTKENVYTVRLYRDNTCINHRTEVRITGSNLHTGTGALIREMECKVDDLF